MINRQYKKGMTPKRLKSFTIAKKVYVDEHGALIHDSLIVSTGQSTKKNN